MTEQEALNLLGMMGLPSSVTELDLICAPRLNDAQAGIKFPRPGTSQNTAVEELKRLTEARQVLLDALSRQGVPGSVRSQAAAQPPRPRRGARPGRARSPQVPQPQGPRPLSPFDRMFAAVSWPWRFLAVFAFGVMLFGLAAWTFLPNPAGQAQIQVWTFPAARVFLDEQFLMEAPSPSLHVIPSGKHQIKIKPKNDDPAVTFDARFRANEAYLIKVDSREKQHTIERISP